MRPKDICNMVPYLCGLTNAKKRSWVVLESSQHFVVFKPKQFEQISDVISCKDIRNRIITVNRSIWPKEDRGIWNLKLFCFFSSYARSVGGITQLLWCGWVLSNVLFSYACIQHSRPPPTPPLSQTKLLQILFIFALFSNTTLGLIYVGKWKEFHLWWWVHGAHIYRTVKV